MGDTAFNQRITECLIKHPDYFFGEAPPQQSRPRPNKLYSSKPTPSKDSPLPATPIEDVDFSESDLRHSNCSLASETDIYNKEEKERNSSEQSEGRPVLKTEVL